MNRWGRLALLSGLALAISSGVLRGQENVPEKKGRERWREKAREMFKEKLGLTDEQSAKLEAVFKERRKNEESLRDQLKVGLEKLRWQVDAKADSREIAATLTQVDEAKKALRDDEDKLVPMLADFLKPEQRARLLLLRDDWRGRHAGRDAAYGRADERRPMRWRSGMFRFFDGEDGHANGPDGGDERRTGPPASGDE